MITALLPTLIIIFTDIIQIKKIDLEIISITENRFMWFEELKSDNHKVKLIIGNDVEGNMFLTYFNNRSVAIGRENYNYPMARTRELTEPATADINNDGCKDIILFSQHFDTLFLNVFDIENKTSLLEDRFVTTIGGINDKEDYIINWIGSLDGANGHVDYVYFSVAGAFSLYPRRVFRYSYRNDSILTSPNTGSGNLGGILRKSHNDVFLYISGNAYNNTPVNFPYPYPDTCCWFFLYDKNLEFVFDPIPIGTHPANISKALIYNENINLLYWGLSSDSVQSQILKIDHQGNIMDKINIQGQIHPEFFQYKIKKKLVYFFFDDYFNKVIEFIPEEFKIFDNKHLKKLKNMRPLLQEDIDNDGNLELVLQDQRDNSICIFSESLRRINHINFDNRIEDLVSIEQMRNDKSGHLVCATADNSAIFLYQINTAYRFRFLIWLGIYVLSAAIIYIALLFQKYQFERRLKLQNRIRALQLKNLNAQLDPHFTFNVLNTVGNAIYQERKEAAYSLFQRFSRLIRSSLTSTDKILRPLVEEIEFTKDYLEFQKTRFKNLFDYKVELAKDVDVNNTQVPKMLMQGFAENAVKHAFYGIDYMGLIKIKIVQEDAILIIQIADNGIGITRSKAEAHTSGTGKGEYLFTKQIEQINHLYKTNIRIHTTNLSNVPGSVTGTHVEISIPL